MDSLMINKAPTGQVMEKEFMFMKVEDGVLRFENGDEVTLWGHNFQPNLYWEYKFRMEHAGIAMTLEVMQEMCDDGFADMKKMGSDLIRCHLTPADFSDAKGDLVKNMWLDMLAYTIAKARENGIYVYLTFINHMDFTLIKESFVANSTREEWIFDPDVVAYTHNMVRQLINYENPYTGIKLKDDPVIAVWGLINEPEYMTFQQMNECSKQKQLFFAWLEKNEYPFNDVYYAKYRREVVRDYIDALHALLRSEGSQQPVIWNCNWPRMIDSRKDVFAGIADSKADAVAFCLYPGQDDVAAPFVEHPADMSDRNYLPFLKYCNEDFDHLAWLRSPQFAKKAKVVYEFETMYNPKSAYLHPAIAKLFRSLGVQMATCWTHTFNVYAQYLGGSHVLNLKTTPKKALSYMVAGNIFKTLDRGNDFELLSDQNDCFSGFAFSRETDSCLMSRGGVYMSVGDSSWSGILPSEDPKEIIGYGSSPLVNYEGEGLYFIDIKQESVEIEVFPHSKFVRNPCEWHTDGGIVTELDYKSEYPFELKLPGRDTISLSVAPGRYSINF